MTRWSNDLLTQLEDCEAEEARMNEWESQFVEDLQESILAGKKPNPKQKEILNELWCRVAEKAY